MPRRIGAQDFSVARVIAMAVAAAAAGFSYRIVLAVAFARRFDYAPHAAYGFIIVAFIRVRA